MVVGVVADFKLNALDRKPYPEIFWSARQIPGSSTWIMARTKMDSSLLAGVLRQRIQAVDSDLPMQEMHSLNEVIADSLWLKRLSATLIGVVAVLAIMLAAAGIYSVMAYSVSQRRKEVGIRVAFGADRHHVLGLIMGETCRLAILGCVVGCTAAFIAGRLATQMVHLSPGLASSQSQESLNPAAFVVSSLFLCSVALLASLVPARRAMRVDPMVALRCE